MPSIFKPDNLGTTWKKKSLKCVPVMTGMNRNVKLLLLVTFDMIQTTFRINRRYASSGESNSATQAH